MACRAVSQAVESARHLPAVRLFVAFSPWQQVRLHSEQGILLFRFPDGIETMDA
jgi:hypothetical protein